MSMTQALEQLSLLHSRSYETKAYRDGENLKIVGSVKDVKPPGTYIDDDPEPLEIHHMQIVLSVEVATLTITGAVVEFRTHPNESCPSIVEHYGNLVGLHVTRGFNRKIRELFGGPRACTHTTALLQAMAPVVIQSLWSLRMHKARGAGQDPFERDRNEPAGHEVNLNTCHVWVEDGEMIRKIRAGEQLEAPVWIKRRFAELGRDPNEWLSPAI
jgi:hypothetical protein